MGWVYGITIYPASVREYSNKAKISEHTGSTLKLANLPYIDLPINTIRPSPDRPLALYYSSSSYRTYCIRIRCATPRAPRQRARARARRELGRSIIIRGNLRDRRPGRSGIGHVRDPRRIYSSGGRVKSFSARVLLYIWSRRAEGRNDDDGSSRSLEFTRQRKKRT